MELTKKDAISQYTKHKGFLRIVDLECTITEGVYGSAAEQIMKWLRKNNNQCPRVQFEVYSLRKTVESKKSHVAHDQKKSQNNETPRIISCLASVTQMLGSRVRGLLNRVIKDSSSVVCIVILPATMLQEALTFSKQGVSQDLLLLKKDNNSQVMTISEAQATAIYYDSYLDKFNLYIGQRFMICHVIESAVKLSTFTVIKSDEPDNAPVMVDLIPSSEIQIGLAHLDVLFKLLVVEELEKISARFKKNADVERIVNYFVDNIKYDFTPGKEESISFPIHTKVGSPNHLSNSNGLKIKNELVITNKEMESRVFEPVVSKIIDHVESELAKLPESERGLHDFILVGSYSGFPYLHSKLVERFEKRKSGIASIIHVPNGDFSVTKGAISFAKNPRLIPSHSTRQTYELKVVNSSGEKSYFREQNVTGCSHQHQDSNVFYTLIRKQMKFKKYDIYSSQVTVQHPTTLTITLYPIGREIDPLNANKLASMYEISVNTSDIINDSTQEKFEIGIQALTLATYIRLRMTHNRKVLREIMVPYKPLLLKYKPKK